MIRDLDETIQEPLEQKAKPGSEPAQATDRVGSAAGSNSHAGALNRTASGQPACATQPLLQLQRQYGNRYVQRVVVRAKQEEGEAEVSPEVEEAIERKRGGGQPLEDGVRAQMGSAFGAEFSGVRVHTDAEADALGRELNARAFTTANDIFFQQRTYQPSTEVGKGLLGHELDHIIQQGGTGSSAVQAEASSVGKPGDAYEREAQAAGQADVSNVLISHQTASIAPSVQREEAGITTIEMPEMAILAGELSEEEIKSAIAYNRARSYKIPLIKIIQRTIGIEDSGIIGRDFVQAAAVWQVDNGVFPAKGKVGPKTMKKLRTKMDERDTLIMQYIDMRKRFIPERSDFVIGGGSTHFSFTELSCRCGQHSWQIISEQLLDGLEDTRMFFGDLRMVVTSGYRCPKHNASISGAAPVSLHLYGLAADIRVQDFNGDGRIDRRDWDALAEAAGLAGARIEPYALTGGWVHMQW